MVIKSNFKDYYDGQKRHDQEAEPVVIRQGNQTVEECQNIFPKVFYNTPWIAIGFAGMIYPAMLRKYTERLWVPRDDYFRDETIFENIWTPERAKEVWPSTRTDYMTGKNKIDLFFEEWTRPQLCDELTKLYGGIFKIYPENGRRYVVRNPRLDGTGIQRVLPAHIAWHNLYRWACNQQRPEKPIPVMSNEVKIQQAGFDLRSSFRGDKGRKPNRKRES